MKTHNSAKIILFLSVTLLSSCTTMLYTSLDVLRPAKITFDASANQLLIVNNTVAQPVDYGHKTEFYNDKSRNVVQQTDSMPTYCLSVIYEELGSSEFFNDVQLHLNSVNNSTDFFTVKALEPDTIEALCKKYKSNVVLSLDRMKVNDKIAELYDETNYSYYTALIARYESQWSVHYPGKDKYGTVIFRDTVFWDAESFQRKNALKALPERADALIDGALYVGQNSVKRFLPYWEKVDRYFFSTNNKKMKEGMDSLYVKNWKAAITIWESAMAKSNMNLKAKLANNIAIAYELTGDIEKAKENVQKSLEYIQQYPMANAKHLAIINKYAIELQNRNKEIEVIDKQLGN